MLAGGAEKENNKARGAVRLPELLAPAGSPEALRAAVLAGADAVYFGGREFSARANAKNFDRDDLRAAISYCRAHGVKTNVTANTLVSDLELDEWLRYGEFLWQAGADAVICADLGAAYELHRRIPELALHLSTQAGICDTGGARLAARLGFSRVVLARELSRQDVLRITADCGIETEIFIHGALCTSVSGQCLFSSLVGGRSGNRGECAQPCRLPYNSAYPLSLRDACMAQHIPEVLTLGVSSLKIEGRMKPPEYVFGVTAVYRRLLDEGRAASEAEMRSLTECFSRSGFTDAYFTGGDRAGMTGVRTEADKQKSAAVRLPDDVQRAITEKKVQILPFPVREMPGCAPGKTDAERREPAAEKETDAERMEPATGKETECGAERWSVRRAFRMAEFTTARQLELSGAKGLDVIFLPAAEFTGGCGANGVIIPAAFFDSELDGLKGLLSEAKAKGAEYALCQSPGGVAMATDMGFKAIGGLRLNIYNSETAKLYRRLGLRELILSPELNSAAVRDVSRRVAGCGTVFWGRIPLMLLTRCVLREAAGCVRCKSGEATAAPFLLKDRRGTAFPVLPEYGHRNIVYNSLPTYICDMRAELMRQGISGEYMVFSVESGVECRKLLDMISKGTAPDFPVRRAGVRSARSEKQTPGSGKTRPDGKTYNNTGRRQTYSRAEKRSAKSEERNGHGKNNGHRYGGDKHPDLRKGKANRHK